MRMHVKKFGVALLGLFPLLTLAQDEEPPVQEEAAAPTVEEYESLLRETSGLRRYNGLRERQIGMQERDLQNLQNAIGEVPDLRLQLPPLLINMVDGLREFIDLDLPFLTEEREDRLANLYLLIEDPNTPEAQKLRRILEAWSIEVEYGNAFQTETGEVMIEGVPRAVDFVILGRVGLLYQTSDDDALTGAWDHEAGDWVSLGSEHRNPVRQAIRMARNQIAPDLLLLPVPPPSNEP